LFGSGKLDGLSKCIPCRTLKLFIGLFQRKKIAKIFESKVNLRNLIGHIPVSEKSTAQAQCQSKKARRARIRIWFPTGIFIYLCIAGEFVQPSELLVPRMSYEFCSQ
jgi:hypothetical protein